MLAPAATRQLRPTLTSEQAGDRVWDAVIVGAGPAGAVAALQMARQGHEVLLVEKSSLPRYKVCGGCLGSTSLALLSELGLSEVIADLDGKPISTLRLHAGGHSARLDLPAGLSVSRQALDAALVGEAIACGVHYLDQTTARLASTGDDRCFVQLSSSGRHDMVEAKVLLAADGLAGTSLAHDKHFTTTVKAAARIGVGALVEMDEPLTQEQEVTMIYAPGGYLGLVQVEGSHLNAAAAFDRSYLRRAGSPAAAVKQHLRRAAIAPPAQLSAAEWTGTPPLTRRRRHVAGRRIFVIGDAAGYVEPFTGEGMAWAIMSALLAAPLAAEAVSGWRDELATDWEAQHRRVIGSRQRACRLVSAVSRSQRLSNLLVRVLESHPTVAGAAVQLLADRGPGAVAASSPSRPAEVVS